MHDPISPMNIISDYDKLLEFLKSIVSLAPMYHLVRQHPGFSFKQVVAFFKFNLSFTRLILDYSYRITLFEGLFVYGLNLD